jgi:peroxiredoxin
MAAETPICDFGWKAPDFRLEGIDGRSYGLDDVRGAKGTLVMFICNHCPYVRSVIDRIVREVAELEKEGIGAVAIMSNDTEAYPADSFDNMKRFAAENRFNFPYLIDRTQEVARPHPGGRTRLRCRLHAGFLRLRRKSRLAVPRPPGRIQA